MLAHRGDDLEIRRERLSAHVEAHLIVALAGAPMRNRRCTFFACDVDEHLGNERPADRRREQILAFVDRAGHQRGKREVVNEWPLAVADDRLHSADFVCAFLDGLKVLLIAEVYRERDDGLGAARMAVWLAWDTAAFRGEQAIANGWLQRAHRLLDNVLMLACGK